MTTRSSNTPHPATKGGPGSRGTQGGKSKLSTSSGNGKNPRQRWVRRGSYVLIIGAGVGAWQLLTMLEVFPAVALPSPVDVYQAFVTLVKEGYLQKTLQQDIYASVSRVLIGFVSAVLIGVTVGLLMARIDVIFRFLDPYLQFGRPVPPLAYIPLFVVWFGIGELPKVLLILVGTVPVIIINTIGGVRNIPEERLEVARCLGATKMQVFLRVVLPSALPEVFTGMKVGIGLAWSTLVAAELIASDVGLGWLVVQAANQLQIGIVIAGIITIGVLGYGMDLCVRLLERLVVPWRGRV